MIDVHCHINSSENIETAEIEDSSIEKVFVCSTSEKDWAKVNTAYKNDKNIIPFFGLHPWYIEEASINWIDELEKLLINEPIAGVGEVGLDKLKPHPKQKEVFISSLELALKYDRPLNIHCVKAFDLLFNILETYKVAIPPMLFHSFNGSPEVVKKLCRYDSFFSFSPRILQSKESKVRTLISAVPLDRLLLESDAEDIRDSVSNFPRFTLKFADFIGIDYRELIEQTSLNAKRFLRYGK